MMPSERNAAYLWDMLTAASLIVDFIQGETYESFMRDKKLQSAVERQLEILGEAARYISTEFRQAHPEIPWRSIVGLRNILVHEYGEVKIDRVWLVA
jgi:uncharacterized protein with HEPN domain